MNLFGDRWISTSLIWRIKQSVDQLDETKKKEVVILSYIQ